MRENQRNQTKGTYVKKLSGMREIGEVMGKLLMWFLTLALWAGVMLMFWYAVFEGDI